MYATDPVAERIDELQFVLGEGPCLDAFHSGRPTSVADLSADTSVAAWPAFAREAGGVGAGAVFAYPAGGRSSPVGVLELYRRTAGPLGPREHDVAVTCAELIGATVTSAWTHVAEQLGDQAAAHDAQLSSSAPLSRAQVHVAAGMVAEQLGVSVDEALDRVRAFAYASDQRVAKVSEDIVAHRVSLAGFGD